MLVIVNRVRLLLGLRPLVVAPPMMDPSEQARLARALAEEFRSRPLRVDIVNASAPTWGSDDAEGISIIIDATPPGSHTPEQLARAAAALRDHGLPERVSIEDGRLLVVIPLVSCATAASLGVTRQNAIAIAASACNGT